MQGFKREVASSIKIFAEKYGMDFLVNIEDEPEGILDNIIKSL